MTIQIPPACPYCGKNSVQVNGEQIYPHRPDLYSKIFYRCGPCDAYVGCHPGTDKPLGRLANASLLKAKLDAHKAFDPLWKSEKWSRRAAYAWLAKAMDMDPARCHIGMMNEAECYKVIVKVNNLLGCAEAMKKVWDNPPVRSYESVL